jgi:maltooligosyltrehalose trehalohydrolase
MPNGVGAVVTRKVGDRTGGQTPLDRCQVHAMPFGAAVLPDGRTRFALWAPRHATVRLAIEGKTQPRLMVREADGWHRLVADDAPPGTRYRFVLPDGLAVPDPASRHQPDDVHGPSEVIDPHAFRWTDGAWRGRPWREAVIAEIHVGAFTPEGTFRAAIDRLDHLIETGITAIELMPVADFPGRWNWGYDGVSLFAPDATYGRPDDMKALIDACHARGLMVLLDVVYNHFGPDGNYLAEVAPLFTARHHTPWGAAIDYDGADAAWNRAFAIHNALYWLEEFHLDGLRLDAVHAIVDDSDDHLLDAIAAAVRGRFGWSREIHLVVENEENEVGRLARGADGRPRTFTAQWNDDVHHVLHVAATGEREGYYADYADDTTKLGRALAEGFAFQGEAMPYRGRPRGEPSAHLPPLAFVSFVQNHDQIGNRAFGDRLTTLAPPEAVRAVRAVQLLLPQVPLLFMGEAWGAEEPFAFFCDFGPDLADAVRDGRRAEFARFPAFCAPEARARIPDPGARETFAAAKLDWRAPERAPHATILDWTRRILTVRANVIVPLMPHLPGGAADWSVIGPSAVAVRWRLEDGPHLCCVANLSAAPVLESARPIGPTIWHENAPAAITTGLGPWEVLWTVEEAGTTGAAPVHGR